MVQLVLELLAQVVGVLELPVTELPHQEMLVAQVDLVGVVGVLHQLAVLLQ